MYLEHFNLKKFPFTLSPDTAFFQDTSGTNAIFRQSIVAINSGAHVLSIVGEPGMGKTILYRKLSNSLHAHRSRYLTLTISPPLLNQSVMLRALLKVLDGKKPLKDQKNKPAEILVTIKAILNRQAANKRLSVLLIDEAQSLPQELLKLLMDIVYDQDTQQQLLRLVLLGHTSLRQSVSRFSADWPRDHRVVHLQLQPLSESGTAAYVVARLQAAGAKDSNLMTPKAYRLLHQCSRGVPRLVNILCHKAMMTAYGSGSNKIDQDHIQAASNDTEATSVSPVS